MPVLMILLTVFENAKAWLCTAKALFVNNTIVNRAYVIKIIWKTSNFYNGIAKRSNLNCQLRFHDEIVNIGITLINLKFNHVHPIIIALK